MAECQNCGQKWKGTTLFKRYITLDPGMECPYCGETQYLTKKYRRRSLLSVLLLPLLIFVPVLIGFGLIFTLVTFVAVFIAIVAIQIFTIELSSEQQTRRDWQN